MDEGTRPLDGIRVLEVGQLLAGPFAGTYLGYFGADVVKVEPPSGDPIRSWRLLDDDGTSLWWRSLARNKRSIALDLRTADGRDEFHRLVGAADVLIENFRPGRMEEWGLGPDVLLREDPRLVYARISGFGQTGPYRERPGYAAVCEAMGGLRHLIGHPDTAPVRANLSLGDTLGGLHAALGILLALRHRDQTGQGQVVDVALTEAVFNVLESVVPEHDRFGVSRPPSGTTVTGIVPSNAYPCTGGRWVVIGANGDSIFRRLMATIGRDDLADDPSLAGNPGRVARASELDGAISDWTATRSAEEVSRILEAVAVPVGRIYDAAELRADPHFEARGLFEKIEVRGKPLTVGALAPRLELTPGRTVSAGPDLDADRISILGDWLPSRGPTSAT
ncbi:MAG: CoA transferase [Deltaproteobacteria bacterium]|nr:CoA transferase [Deltaproteobacteria bacterium]